MPATLETRRECPYCGAKFALSRCDIVATNFENAENLDGFSEPSLGKPLPSGVKPMRWLHKRWPVIAEGPAKRATSHTAEAEGRPLLSQFMTDLSSDPKSREREARNDGPPLPDRDGKSSGSSKSLFGRVRATGTNMLSSLASANGIEDGNASPLPPVADSLASREELRARACPECEYPLPRGIDERKAIVVAVVGANRVGKTHFLAASLTQASQRRGLAPVGCIDFTPADDTSQRFRRDYFLPLFRRNEVLNLSQEAVDDVRFRPLVFDVTFEGVEPFCLVVHDIPGEALGNPKLRVRAATFLRAARGIIVLIDPREVEAIRERLPDHVLERDELAFDQGALLSACLQENGVIEQSRLVPVAMAIGKADLLADAFGDLPFLRPSQPESESLSDFVERTKSVSRDVASFLAEMGAHDLLSPAEAYGQRCRLAERGGDASDVMVTYHAVSALGTQPDADDKVGQKVTPLNCADPLAAVLAQIVGVRADDDRSRSPVRFIETPAPDPLDGLSELVEGRTESASGD
jgi:hypothetical protein